MVAKIKLDLGGEKGEERDVDDGKLGLNKNYANRYNNWRQLEEEQKIKSKYGAAAEESSSSEDEPEWTADDEKTFLKTLGALKGNKESIYDDNTKFWNGESASGPTTSKAKPAKSSLKEKKEKPMYLKDYERKLVVEKGGKIEESDEEEEILAEQQPNYFEQQNDIRKQLKATIGDDDDESDDDILVKKEKTTEEKKKDEDSFLDWLKDQKEEDLPENSELASLKKAWTNPELDEDEKFLRDYLMNKDYEPETDKDAAPSRSDIAELEQDDEELNKQRTYEQKFNFRFEEPDQEFIKQYPRTVNESIRKGDTRRKEKREEYRERKAKEKEEMKNEIKHLKKQKRSQIEKKLDKLKRLAGEDIDLNLDDLTGDFDPQEYDRRMQALFNDAYYDKEGQVDEDGKPVFSDMEEDGEEVYDESVDEDDEADAPVVKPVAKKKTKKKNQKDVVADTDTSGSRDDILKENGEEVEEDDEKEEELYREKDSQRKRKRTSLAAAKNSKKPIFDPNEKTFEQYFNEYHALDYEDIIGDQVTRFRYRQVVPNSFGLDLDEILEADDKQLNAWASLKKATAYRSQEEERYDLHAYQAKAKDEARKRKILSTDYGGMKSKKTKVEEGEEADESTEVGVAGGETTDDVTTQKKTTDDVTTEKKRKRKPKNRKKKTGETPATPVADEEKDTAQPEVEPVAKTESAPSAVDPQKKKRNRKKKVTGEETEQKPTEVEKETSSEKKPMKKKLKTKKKNVVQPLTLGDDRLKAYGLNPKKFKAKLKYAKKKEEQ